MSKQDRTAEIEKAITNHRQSEKMGNFKRLISAKFIKNKSAIGLYIVMITAANMMIPFISWWWKGLIDLFEKSNNQVQILLLLLGYGLFLAIQKVLQLIVSTDGEFIWRYDIVHENRFMEAIVEFVYSKIMRLPLEYFEIPAVNDIMNRALQFTGSSMRQLYVKFFTIIIGGIAAITTLVSIYVLYPWLALFGLVAPIPMFIGQLFIKRVAYKQKRETAEHERKMTYFEGLMRKTSVKEIKAANAGGFFQEKWEEEFRSYMVSFRKATAKQGMISFLGQLFEFLDLPEDTVDNSVTSKSEFTETQFREVSYRYPLTDHFVLDRVNLQIRKGEKVAFVGENGSGKSTVSKLLMGLLTPTSGDITCNGKAVEEENRAAYRRNFSAVFQDYNLYPSLTLHDNVSIANPGRADEVALSALLERYDVPHKGRTQIS